MIRIEVKTTETATRSFTNKAGERKSFRVQDAYAFLGDAYPEKVELALWDDKPAYAIGYYTLGMPSFRVNQYKSLEVNRTLDLVPLPKVTAAKD